MKDLPEGFSGPGLAIVLTVGTEAALFLIPEESGLLPDWIADGVAVVGAGAVVVVGGVGVAVVVGATVVALAAVDVVVSSTVVGTEVAASVVVA